MTIQEVMERIRLPMDAREAIWAQPMTEEEYREWAAVFWSDRDCFFERWSRCPDREQWLMRFYMRLACDVYERYVAEMECERSVMEEIYNDSLYDFTIWVQHYRKRHGRYGLSECRWLALTMSLKLFRLGRLQFEPVKLQRELVGTKRTIRAWTDMLNVHIPEGEPLSPETCAESFRRAEAFFGAGKYEYMCQSWLLAPDLGELLPDDSNILRFQRLFDIVEVSYFMPQAEERIFGTVMEEKENYPEETLLQRSAKQWFLQGKDPGIGLGFIDDVYKNITE